VLAGVLTRISQRHLAQKISQSTVGYGDVSFQDFLIPPHLGKADHIIAYFRKDFKHSGPWPEILGGILRFHVN
jgi:hypothetical protein